MRFWLKRKKENELSFYALHQKQLLSEVLFSTARFVSEKLVHPVIWSEKSLRGSAFSAALRLIDLRSEMSQSELETGCLIKKIYFL